MKLFRSNMPQGRKILVIYEDPQIMTLLRLVLQKAYKDTVIEAASGNEGLAQAQATLPDLIIIEMALPESSGPEICKRLKAAPVLQRIPILFIGAPQKNYRGARDLGAQGYLMKPFDPSELRKARNELLKGKTHWPSTDLWPPFD